MAVKLFFQILSGILGLLIAVKFVPGVEFNGSVQELLLIGGILGLVNFFIKPALKLVSLPLRIITLGLFSLVINMALIWLAVDVLSPIEMRGLIPIFWTAVIIWLLDILFKSYLSNLSKKNKEDD